MNPMLQKPQLDEPRVHLLCTDPDLKQAWLETTQQQAEVVEKAKAFAKKVGMRVELYYSNLDSLEIRYLPTTGTDIHCKRVGFRTYAPHQVAAKGSSREDLLAFQERFAAASEEVFGHGHPLRACRARQLSLFLGNPTCLNWPDCPNVYLVEEGVVFYGKRSGIEKYLSKLGLSVSLFEPKEEQA